MKKIFLAMLSALLVSTSYVAAQSDLNEQLNPLLTGVPSLTITPDARAGGMGDVGVATTPDINSQYWNVSKYAFMESPAGFTFSYTPWLSKLVSDINLLYTAGYWKFDELQSVSASLRYFSLGEIKLRGERPDDDYGTANPYEMSFDLGYSRMLSDKWSAGVAFRYIRSDLNNGVSHDTQFMTPGNAIGADVATYYRTPIELSYADANLAFGLNISNIGSKISYDENLTSIFIPTNLRLGTSFDYPIDDYNKISVSVDMNKLLVPTPVKQKEGESVDDYLQRRDEYEQIGPIAGIFKSFADAPGGMSEEFREIMWSVGTEYAYNDQFFIRGGYFHENQFKGNRKYFTAGVGFKMNMFQIDAAYLISAAQSNPLDQTLRFTLGFDLDGLKNLMR